MKIPAVIINNPSVNVIVPLIPVPLLSSHTNCAVTHITNAVNGMSIASKISFIFFTTYIMLMEVCPLYFFHCILSCLRFFATLFLGRILVCIFVFER